MGTTICTDALTKLAKASQIISNAQPGEDDPNYQNLVNIEKQKYENLAKQIFNVESLKIKADFNLKKGQIIANKPLKEAEYMMARFNSTDIEQYGEDGIKTTISRELSKLKEGIEVSFEKQNDLIEKVKQKMDNAQISSKTKEMIDRANNTINNYAEKISKLGDYFKDKIDLNAIASGIGNATDKDLDKLAEDFDKQLSDFENTVYGQAKSNGEKKGTEMLETYNNQIIKTAKSQFDTMNKNISKASIAAQAAISKAKLQLGALVGL